MRKERAVMEKKLERLRELMEADCMMAAHCCDDIVYRAYMPEIEAVEDKLAATYGVTRVEWLHLEMDRRTDRDTLPFN